MRELPFDLRFEVGDRGRAPRARLAAQGQRVPVRGQARSPLRAPRRRRGAMTCSSSATRTSRGCASTAACSSSTAARSASRRTATRAPRSRSCAPPRRASTSRSSASPTTPRPSPPRSRGRAARRSSPTSWCWRRQVTAPLPRRLLGRVPRLRAARGTRHRLGHRRPGPSNDVGLQLLENAAATAAGLFAIILMFGPVSGGHFNPVVSLVDAAFGGMSLAQRARLHPRRRSPAASAARSLANGMFALAAISISAHHRANPRTCSPRSSRPSGCSSSSSRSSAPVASATAPAAVGAYIGAAIWFTSSTSFANPAITVGRMFSDTFAGIAPASAPSYIAAQLVGCVARRRAHPRAVSGNAPRVGR